MEKTRAFKGFQCWKPDRINVVINKEAVSVDRANFLATHVPLGRIRYERTPRAMHDPGENGLLKALLESQAQDEHAFAIVRGIPGTGKSHLIRWLKERYEASQPRRVGGDVVLLIERAQCTLRGSIEQIIRSGVFGDAHMRQQLERLKDATTELSKQALADNVLAQLQVAAKNEVESPTIERPRGRMLLNLEDFLLDRTIREHLKRPGGPVDRIMRFLTYGKDARVAANEEPRFDASDFDLPETVMVALRAEGYQTTRELAKDLRTFPARRGELAAYLNRLLEVAVGRLTALTAEDLKGMFSDLRRELRQQGKGLALFIEDITAFTGIDRGLVDVLATQHTGEANQQFCRMLSVIGVTDSYYTDSFPTNIKERVTLHLSLNAEVGEDGREAHEAALLRDTGAQANLAGRYLNAMRLTQEELDDWLAQGADPQRLPNACARCPFQAPCHAAFGQAPASEMAQPVGLYPFNARALTQLYHGVKGTTQTPRSFLNDVIAYVLHSYGDDVEAGEFPPSPTELNERFRVPLLLQPVQAGLIMRQTRSPEDADRIESLVRLWGDRTAYSRELGGKRLVGGLPESVFTAFQATFIAGESAEDSVNEPPRARTEEWEEMDARHGPHMQAEPAHPQEPTPANNLAPARPTSADAGRLTSTYVRPPSETSSPLAEDIEGWRHGGRLKSYEDFAGRLVAFLRTAIAWDAYGITREEVSERLQKQYLVFEDQGGQLRSADHILFKRSGEMVSVLHALLYLTGRADSLAPAITAGHLARLGAWLRVEEPRIVAFVGAAGRKADEQLSARDVLILSAALLEVLYGGLDQRCDSPEALLAAILARASDPPRVSDVIASVEGVRNPAWIDALRVAAPTQELWKRLLSMLNRPQGRSTESGESGAEENSRRPVYFLDVMPALHTLDALLKSDWELPVRAPTTNGRPAVAAPGSPEKVYDDVRARFDPLLQEARQIFVGWNRDLDAFFGHDSPVDVLNAVRNLLRNLQNANQTYLGSLDNLPEGSVVEAARAGAQTIAGAASRTQLALALSPAKEVTRQTRRTVSYFRSLAQFLKEKSAALDGQLERLRGASEARELTTRVQQGYSELEQMLTQASASQRDSSGVALPADLERRGR